ncbi:MAG: transposase [Thermodesulfobacteriota bacterium]|nr:transposase [Thermodesulfobacteriota bacterium]
MKRDRRDDFKTQVIPRSKRYEDELRQDVSMMFLTGGSTRSLSMISTMLIGWKISPTRVGGSFSKI